MPQQNERDELVSDQQTFGLLYGMAITGTWLVAPFIRSGLGKRAGGRPLLLALLILMLTAGRTRSEAMQFYLWSWIGMTAYRRLTPGRDVVTEYQGRPFITAWLAGDELTARLAEVPLVFLVGAAVAGASPAVGKLLMWASLGLAVRYWIESTYQQRLDEAMDDEILIMQSRMARRDPRFRERR